MSAEPGRVASPSGTGGTAKLRLKQIRWHLTGVAGPSIRWFIKARSARFIVGCAIAGFVCRGNQHGKHTPHYDARFDLGGQCLCDRVRRRLDFIPF